MSPVNGVSLIHGKGMIAKPRDRMVARQNLYANCGTFYSSRIIVH